MAEKVKYKATNIETGEEHIGNADELSKILYAPTGEIYRTASTGTRLSGVWKIEKITFKKYSDPSKRFPYKVLNDWDALTGPYIRRRELKMQEERICVVCNKPFVTTVPSRLCCSPECSVERDKQTRREYMREYSKSANTDNKPRKKKRISKLAQINAEARAAGMTYGQYVGVMGL